MYLGDPPGIRLSFRHGPDHQRRNTHSTDETEQCCPDTLNFVSGILRLSQRERMTRQIVHNDVIAPRSPVVAEPDDLRIGKPVTFQEEEAADFTLWIANYVVAQIIGRCKILLTHR